MSERNGFLSRVNLTWQALAAFGAVAVLAFAAGSAGTQWWNENRASPETVAGLDSDVSTLEGGQAINRTSIDGLLSGVNRMQIVLDTLDRRVGRLYCDRWPDDCTPQPSPGP